MYYENINEKNLDKFKDEKNVIVEVYSQWCGPCKMLKSVLKEFAEKRDDVHVIALEIEENQEFAAANNVIGTPTTFVYFNGTKTKPSVFEGYIPLEEWDAIIEKGE